MDPWSAVLDATKFGAMCFQPLETDIWDVVEVVERKNVNMKILEKELRIRVENELRTGSGAQHSKIKDFLSNENLSVEIPRRRRVDSNLNLSNKNSKKVRRKNRNSETDKEKRIRHNNNRTKKERKSRSKSKQMRLQRKRTANEKSFGKHLRKKVDATSRNEKKEKPVIERKKSNSNRDDSSITTNINENKSAESVIKHHILPTLQRTNHHNKTFLLKNFDTQNFDVDHHWNMTSDIGQRSKQPRDHGKWVHITRNPQRRPNHTFINHHERQPDSFLFFSNGSFKEDNNSSSFSNPSKPRNHKILPITDDATVSNRTFRHRSRHHSKPLPIIDDLMKHKKMASFMEKKMLRAASTRRYLKYGYLREYDMDEDCLTLNIYKPLVSKYLNFFKLLSIVSKYLTLVN